MTTTDTPISNGVDTAALFATLDAVKASPDIAKFQFRATNRWISGTHNRSTIHGFFGAGLACRTWGRQRGSGSGLAPDVELVGLEDEIGAPLPVADESP